MVAHQVDHPKVSPLKGVADPSAQGSSKDKKCLSRGGLQRPLVGVGVAVAGAFVYFWMFTCWT